MLLTLEIGLALVLLVGLGVWGVVSGVRASREERRQAVPPQELGALAQPYRGLLGEAVAIQRDIADQAAEAPAPLRPELIQLSQRVEVLVGRALPRARHGTRLAGYLLRLEPGDAQRPETERAAGEVLGDLERFLETLKLIRGKVYQVLTDATALHEDRQLRRDLDDALIDVASLEEAFGEARAEVARDLP